MEMREEGGRKKKHTAVERCRDAGRIEVEKGRAREQDK